MQTQTAENDRRVIDLDEYRRGKSKHATAAEEAVQQAEEDVLKKVSYHLLMAARAIAGRQGSH